MSSLPVHSPVGILGVHIPWSAALGLLRELSVVVELLFESFIHHVVFFVYNFTKTQFVFL